MAKSKKDFKKLDIAKLLEDVDIMDVIDDLGLQTQKHGSRISILCPCHPDRHFGSCFVTDFGFYCFSCHAHGNAIDLVKESEHVDFLTAARRVASICGGESGYYLNESDEDDNHTRLPKEILRVVELSDTPTIYSYSTALSEDEMMALKMDGTFEEKEMGRSIWDYEPGSVDEDGGYYLLREPIARKPLQALIDDDPEMFDCLVYNKAVEKFQRYKYLEQLAKGNALFMKAVSKELNSLQRIIDEYKQRLARYNDPELKALVCDYKPQRSNPFGRVGKCF